MAERKAKKLPTGGQEKKQKAKRVKRHPKVAKPRTKKANGSGSKAVSVKIPSAEQLLEARVHFGHLKRRWHPKMAPFIYTDQEGVHIFDLYKTREKLERACRLLREKAAEGSVLFVGTKRHSKGIIEREAERAGAFHLSERWVGGLLTNFESVHKNVKKLEELSRKVKEGEFKHYTKKERLLIDRQIRKLDRDIGGLQGMERLPVALVLASAKSEAIAAREARGVGIPVVAITDTDANPGLVDYVIPGNDDAATSVEIIIKTLADAALSGRKNADGADKGR
jgi:small subunit ribosomal protein S2